MVVDPATGEGPKSDATAISVTAKDERTGIAFTLEDWAKRALPHETIEQIFAFAQKWPVHIVSPEDAAYQKTLKHYLRAEMARRGVRFIIRPVKPGNRSKGTRIEGLEPWVRNGKVAVRKEHLSGVVKEATDVVIVRGMVQGPSPNRLDALAYQIEHWGGLVLPSSPKSDTEEIQHWNSLEEKGETRAYGLSCMT
jgi:predicted phage terminase large subunit-like protein